MKVYINKSEIESLVSITNEVHDLLGHTDGDQARSRYESIKKDLISIIKKCYKSPEYRKLIDNRSIYFRDKLQ